MTRLAIVGLGAVTRNIHLPAYARLQGTVEVVGGCDPDADARARVAGQVPAVFESVDAMLEQTRPDVVAVCTPPSMHLAHCRAAFEAGCHVLCEKPLAMTLEDAAAIVEAAKAAGRQVVVNAQFPYMATYQAAKAALGTADVGRLLFLHAWQTFRRTDATEAGWRGEMTRRLAFEFGVHVFELVRYFFDATPNHLMAHLPAPLPGEHADVVNTIALGFPDGRGAAIVLDRVSQGPHRYLELRLSAERAAIHTSIGGEVRVAAGLHTSTRRPFLDVSVVKGGKAVLQQGERERVLAKEDLNPFAAATARHLTQFLEAVAAGQTPRGTAEDHLETLALALATYASAETGRAVDPLAYLHEQLA